MGALKIAMLIEKSKFNQLSDKPLPCDSVYFLISSSQVNEAFHCKLSFVSLVFKRKLSLV